VRQDFGAPGAKALKVLRRLKATAVISADEFFDGVFPISGNDREDLLRDRKDVSANLSRKPVIEHTHFVGARSILLRDQRRACQLKILSCLLSRSDELYSDTALTHIWLENEWVFEVTCPAQLVKAL
jgi:DNA-binding winged helix-turn-helix (wHTH) protein